MYESLHGEHWGELKVFKTSPEIWIAAAELCVSNVTAPCRAARRGFNQNQVSRFCRGRRVEVEGRLWTWGRIKTRRPDALTSDERRRLVERKAERSRPRRFFKSMWKDVERWGGEGGSRDEQTFHDAMSYTVQQPLLLFFPFSSLPPPLRLSLSNPVITLLQWYFGPVNTLTHLYVQLLRQ